MFYDRVRCPVSHRKDAYAGRRNVLGHGYWTVLGSYRVRGVGWSSWWHEIVRGDGEQGWVDNLQNDFVVCKDDENT